MAALATVGMETCGFFPSGAIERENEATSQLTLSVPGGIGHTSWAAGVSGLEAEKLGVEAGS